MKVQIILILILLISLGSVTSLSNEKCEDLYFLVTKTNYEYNDLDLINLNLTRDEIYNYEEECTDSDYPKLPQKSIPVITINEKETLCNYELGFPLGGTINLFTKKLESPSCSDLKILRVFFGVEFKAENYFLSGINLFSFGIVFLAVGLFWIIRSRRTS